MNQLERIHLSNVCVRGTQFMLIHLIVFPFFSRHYHIIDLTYTKHAKHGHSRHRKKMNVQIGLKHISSES